MKAYENHVARNGKPPSVRSTLLFKNHTFNCWTALLTTRYPLQHALAKQMLAGFAAAEVDKLFETKGMSP